MYADSWRASSSASMNSEFWAVGHLVCAARHFSEPMSSINFSSHAAFIWSVADLLRGDYKQSDYGKVILPFTVLRRLDCVLEATKPAVLKGFEARKVLGAAAGPFLAAKSGFSFYNTSPMDFAVLQGDPRTQRRPGTK